MEYPNTWFFMEQIVVSGTTIKCFMNYTQDSYSPPLWKKLIIFSYSNPCPGSGNTWCMFTVMQPDKFQDTGLRFPTQQILWGLFCITIHIWNYFFYFMQYAAFEIHKQFGQALTQARWKLLWGIDGKYSLTPVHDHESVLWRLSWRW